MAAQDNAMALRALALAGQWNRLARGHVGMSACLSCTCNPSFSSIPIAQLGLDLIEYLQDKHQGSHGLRGWLSSASQQGHTDALTTLLRHVAEGGPKDANADAGLLLEDIERWMEGIAKMAC